ncbi:MAG TPA: BON domain-containing protein [Puia sp.]|jgi:osmotically-inducible protein OsmY|uniref:BON domain-containing protein n=1 Tax=Puia sp. TaxID=2045100 RepID=UPI002CA1C33B|nr:BON domain-containing protein [Puia sp.]HVU94129.1 BON domain-containing protein [Puia sp.]
MRTDADIQKDVMAQLKWEAFLHAENIGVAVKDGVVTLSGHVDSYNKKIGAEMAAKKVLGVKAVAEEINVGVSPIYRRTDTEIAEAVVNALRWHSAVVEDKIKVKVEDGVVTLDGQVDWNFQRQNAVDAIQNLIGVIRVNNFIVVKPSPTSNDLQEKIRQALLRSATVDSDKIAVTVTGSKAILTGTVRSLAEKDDAELAAWSGRGITSVENRLEIAIPEFSF